MGIFSLSPDRLPTEPFGFPPPGEVFLLQNHFKMNPMKRKIATGLLVFLSLIAIAFGLHYLFAAHLMKYHISFLQMAELQLNQVDGRIVALFLVLIRIVGGCMTAIGVASLILAWVPFRKQERWAWWTVLALFSISLLTLGIITFPVAQDITNGPRPPWWLATGMLAVLAVALFLSPPKKKPL